MNILFGVQGTGHGHIMRSREVLKHLKARGHQVRIVISGRHPAILSQLEVFHPYQFLRGLTFSTSKGRIKIWQTALELNLYRFYSDIHRFDPSGTDLIITDFEPITARVGRRYQIPTIGLGHQYAFLQPIPTQGGNPFTFWIIRHFASVQYPIGLHWHHFNCPILPPIVPDILAVKRPLNKKKILVYLPFECLSEVVQVLKPIEGFEFWLYADVGSPEDDGCIHVRPLSRTRFLADLAECNGVIANAGFETVGEALYLGKKILVKPLQGQLEQLSNAKALSNLKLGTVMPHLDRTTVKDWLHLPPLEPVNYPDVAKLVAQWIETKRWDHTADLVATAWANVNLPI